MGFLRVDLAVLVASAACYAPDVRDCKVTCDRTLDCADGQVCGSDRFCAAPGASGTCGSSATIDASMTPPDAPFHPPDAQATVELQIMIMGNGSVELTGGGTCTTSCTLAAPFGVVATLYAVPDPKQQFDRWETLPCAGQPTTCTFVALAPAMIAVRFEKADNR
jgi:hypothetical protein